MDVPARNPVPTHPDPLAWRAILTRDGSWDGRLYYGVRTTGVYCRPSCPSRRPNRENVRIFPSSRAARGAGYRPCKRCWPDRDSAPDPTREAVERAQSVLDASPLEPIPLGRLAAEVGMSPHHLHRAFRRLVGLTPKAYGDARRVAVLKDRLRTGETVTRAAFEAGFGSVRAAYDRGEAGMGMPPGAYRAGGVGIRIRFAVTRTPVGLLLLGATDRGVCAVVLGDSGTDLREALAAEFPRAERVEDPEGLEPWLDAIRKHLEGENPKLDLPVDVSGTEFQRAVWRALTEVPYGATRTYGEIARSIGRPGASRAVGRACGANRVALVIPCHRAVRKDGASGGYRWGPATKRALLDRERERSEKPRQRNP